MGPSSGLSLWSWLGSEFRGGLTESLSQEGNTWSWRALGDASYIALSPYTPAGQATLTSYLDEGRNLPSALGGSLLTSDLALVHSCVSCCVLPSSLQFCLSSNQPWAPGHRAFAPASSSIWVVFLPSSGYCLSVLQVSTHASSSGALPGCPNQTQGLIAGSHGPQTSSQHISEAGCVAMCIQLETISPTGLCSVRTGVGLRLLTVASPVYTVARGRECSVSIP